MVFYKDFKDIGNQTKKSPTITRNKKHLEEIKKLEQIEDNLDEKLIESMKKHDTKEKVNFKSFCFIF